MPVVPRKKTAPAAPKSVPAKPVAPLAAVAPIAKPAPKPAVTMTMPATPKCPPCPPCPPCPTCKSQTCVKACVNWYYFLFLLLALIGVGAVLLQGVMLNKFVDLRFTAIEQNIEAIQASQARQDVQPANEPTAPVSTTIYTDEKSGLTFVVPSTKADIYSPVRDVSTSYSSEFSSEFTIETADTDPHPEGPACLTLIEIFPSSTEELPEVTQEGGTKVYSDDVSTVYATEGETCGVTFARLK